MHRIVTGLASVKGFLGFCPWTQPGKRFLTWIYRLGQVKEEIVDERLNY